MLGVNRDHERYLKVIPVTYSGYPSQEVITNLTVESDKPESLAASVADNGMIRITALAKGTVNLIITAQNDVSGHKATTSLTFEVVATEDIIDVVSGSGTDVSGSLYIENKYLESVSFKLKENYKNLLTIVKVGSVDGSNDVTTTEQDGVFTVTHTTLRSSTPGDGFQVNQLNGVQQGYVSVLFEPDDEAKYPLTSANVRVSSFYGTEATDGETLSIDLEQWQDHDIQAEFGITPNALRNAKSVITTVTSSDESVALVKPDEILYLNNDRKIPVKILAAGTTTLTLTITDGLEYEDTAIITVVVTE